MPKEESLIELVDGLIIEDKEIIDEFIKEELQPMIDYNIKREKQLFEKAYSEVLKLEEI